MVNGIECSEIYVYQRCWRGTDNGVDAFYGVDENRQVKAMREEHPILLCGAKYFRFNKDTGLYDEVTPGDVDTIVVRDVQIECVCRDKDGNVVEGATCELESHDGETRTPISGWHTLKTELNYDDGGPSLVFNNWLRVFWKEDGSYCADYGSIVTDSMSDNLTNDVREVRFWLRSSYQPTEEKPLLIWSGCTCDECDCDKVRCQPQHHDEEACQEWEYPVMQAPRCYGWCKIGSHENRVSLTYDAGHSTCSQTYEDLWNKAVAADEQHDQQECHVDETDPNNPNTQRFRDCRQ